MAKSNSTKAKTEPAAEAQQEGTPAPTTTEGQQDGTNAPATTEDQQDGTTAPAATEGQQDGTAAPATTEEQQDGTNAPATTEDQQDGTAVPATTDEQQEGTPAPTAETYVVEAAHGLNLRKAPRFGAKVLTILPDGAEISVALGVEAPTGWLPVLENDEVAGWVYARYLKKLEE